MYTLTTPLSSITFPTLVEVFQQFQTEPGLSDLATADIHLSRHGEPVAVTRFNGALTIRHEMPAADLARLLVDEVARAWFMRDDQITAPWQVRPKHWASFQALFALDRDVRMLFSSSQIETEKSQARERGTSFQFSELIRTASRERLGFDFNGPAEPGTGFVNGRHEVHVAYALAFDRPVPEAVLADYSAMEDPFRYGLEWAIPLFNLPVLRGKLPPRKWAGLAQVLRHAKITLNSESADAYIHAVRSLADDVDPLEIDNRLYAAGLLRALPLPDRFMSAVDVGEPVSELAARLRVLLADHRRAADLKRADDELAKGQISRRVFELQRQMILLDHGRSTFEWPNRLATAMLECDVGYLLSVLDTADDLNRVSKQAVREVLGVKLRGLKSAERRRAVFALCGMDEAAQSSWEASESGRREAQQRADDAKRAREAAEATRYRRPDGSVVSGADHVDESIAAGFVEIRDRRKGASREYGLVNPASRDARTLRAKDGTLAYARAVLHLQHAA